MKKSKPLPKPKQRIPPPDYRNVSHGIAELQAMIKASEEKDKAREGKR